MFIRTLLGVTINTDHIVYIKHSKNNSIAFLINGEQFELPHGASEELESENYRHIIPAQPGYKCVTVFDSPMGSFQFDEEAVIAWDIDPHSTEIITPITLSGSKNGQNEYVVSNPINSIVCNYGGEWSTIDHFKSDVRKRLINKDKKEWIRETAE
jgi:hypothetical protein